MNESPWESPGVPRKSVADYVRANFQELDDDELGAVLKLSARVVRRIRHAIGALRGNSTKSRVDDDELLACHLSGLTTHGIAAALGVSVVTVRDRLRSLGHEPRHPPRPSRDQGFTARVTTPCTPAQLQELQAAADARGVTLAQESRERLWRSS